MTLSASRKTALCRELPDARELYDALLRTPEEYSEAAARFLDEQLQAQVIGGGDLPGDPQRWPGWLAERARCSASEYAAYLSERRAGAPRRFFHSRIHALYFLQAVRPTKLVDGAWLYGALNHCDDPRALPLVHIYLEELGHGITARNHVLIYRQLLESLGCDTPLPLSDAHYLQGAVQLAFGYLADDYLPELLGYNLGYELPPLHLMITSHELRELGIDPRYFRLHVTIDNAGSGHGRKALAALNAYLPRLGDRESFLRRVQAGYRLNDAGLSCQQIIDGFDLHAELLEMLERKRPFAQRMHDDRARIGGLTVNQWLAAPGRMGEFLQALEDEGWLIRHAEPARSRLWRLVEGDEAAMFGVFTPHEKQLLHDWIAGDWHAPQAQSHWRGGGRLGASDAPARADFAAEERALLNELSGLSPRNRRHRLIALMAPHKHWTSAGLMATRIFADKLGIEP